MNRGKLRGQQTSPRPPQWLLSHFAGMLEKAKKIRSSPKIITNPVRIVVAIIHTILMIVFVCLENTLLVIKIVIEWDKHRKCLSVVISNSSLITLELQ